MTNFSMAASHAAGKGKDPDAVFAVLKEANAAIAKLGLDKVVNATIGAIYDEEEQFAYFSTVSDYFHQIVPEELMNYAPIGGLPEFHQAVIEQTFGASFPANCFAKAVATPGGTGAIRNAFHNYLEPGQKALVPDWFWSNYRNILEEDMRALATYTMFDAENRFNVASVKENIRELLKVQDNLVVVFNSPAHNPTGHCIKDSEWIEILDFTKECAADKKKKITILLDIAYMDYAGDPVETRKFFRLFTDLPENLLIAIAYSMSKSYLIYGMRSGALIGLSSSQEVVDEFFRINVASNRGVWSNRHPGCPAAAGRCAEESGAESQNRSGADSLPGTDGQAGRHLHDRSQGNRPENLPLHQRVFHHDSRRQHSGSWRTDDRKKSLCPGDEKRHPHRHLRRAAEESARHGYDDQKLPAVKSTAGNFF